MHGTGTSYQANMRHTRDHGFMKGDTGAAYMGTSGRATRMRRTGIDQSDGKAAAVSGHDPKTWNQQIHGIINYRFGWLILLK